MRPGYILKLNKLCSIEKFLGISPPFQKTNYNAETVLKCTEKYLSHADLDQGLLAWARRPVIPEDKNDEPGGPLDAEVDLLLAMELSNAGIK